MEMNTIRRLLEEQKYIFDEDFLVTIYITLKLEKPLLIEGAAGVGKTEVAKALAAAFNYELIRLQCYEGLDETRALYEWNYAKQLLSMQAGMAQKSGVEGVFSEEYLLERPLLKAIKSTKKSVLLIDEIDKSDEEFEAFLLEILSDFQVSIPEIGTVKAISKPIVILTSNNTRQLSDALKRRCTYLFIDYPSIDKEMSIIEAKIPGVGERLAREAATEVARLRNIDMILKKPSIAETLDWVAALMAIDKTRLDKDGVNKTLGFVLKNREDIQQYWKDGDLNRQFVE